MTSWCHVTFVTWHRATIRNTWSRDPSSRHYAKSRKHRDAVTVCTWWRQEEYINALMTSRDHSHVISVTSPSRMHATNTKALTAVPLNATDAIIPDVSWFRWGTRSTEPDQNQKSHAGIDESISISHNFFLWIEIRTANRTVWICISERWKPRARRLFWDH